jgi:hypothetical protein
LLDVEMTFRDVGCGIEPAFLPHVFERFPQQDASSTRRKGGLAWLLFEDWLVRLWLLSESSAQNK